MAKTSNGGIMGSGIFGIFGTTIKCDASDNSMYCNIMKFFNLFMLFLFFCYIFYFIYTYFSFNGKKRKY